MAARPSAPKPAGGSPPAIQLPKLVTDPIASLAWWPIDVSLGDLDLQFPAMPAAQWLSVLMRPNVSMDEIFFDLLPEDAANQVDDAILTGSIDYDELYDTCLDVIAVASARPWYVAMKLIITAVQSWDSLGGELTLQGVDAARLSLAAWLDGLFLVMLRNMKEESITMFLLKLEQPPEGYEAEAEIETSRDQFLQMMT